jgi:FkbM family methyltransferase
MGKVGAFLSSRYRPPVTADQVSDFIDSHKLQINFIIEAGAHHGVDTKRLLEIQSVRMVYCFEPNPESRIIFQSNLRLSDPRKYDLFEYGLFDKEMSGYLFQPTMDLGKEEARSAGNSSLLRNWGKSEGSGYQVQLIELDRFFDKRKIDLDLMYGRSGLLWLDVEGAALNSLRGMKKALDQVALAKVEVQYGKQPGQWESSNIFQVITFMYRKGFRLHSGYLHPLTRGDVFFMRSDLFSKRESVNSITYLVSVYLLYGSVYPILWNVRRWFSR